MAPVMLRGKLIVIDDIERKHAKLGIDEILGFIDEYSHQYASKFILVLNDDQLSTKDDQKELWATFREKVIDQEIKLSTSADEAFLIAISLRPSKYTEAIRRASVTCSLTNIRVVDKVIKVANQILSDRELDEAIQDRVVPSIVLLSAIHYRGIDGGPDFKFVLNYCDPSWSIYTRKTAQTQTPEEKLQEDWRMLMQELGIHSSDEFELQLAQFLESGLFDAANIEALIDRYAFDCEAIKMRRKAQQFLKRAYWDHRVEEVELLNEATYFLGGADRLDPFLATELQSALSDLPGGAAIGEAIIDRWIAAYKESNPSEINDESIPTKPLHPRILAVFSEIKAASQANTSVVDACMYVMENGGWGTLQEVVLGRATVADFELAIREMEDLEKLSRFMRQMIKMRLQRTTYDSVFGTATEHFAQACRDIANDPQSPRLARLVRRLYNGTLLEPELVQGINSDEQNLAERA